MSTKLRPYEISEPVFQSRVFILVGWRSQETRRHYKRKFGGDIDLSLSARDQENDEIADGMTFSFPGGKVVYITFPDATPLLSTVVHECTHAAITILHNSDALYRGAEFDEPLAYYLGWLVGEVAAYLERQEGGGVRVKSWK